MTTPSTTASTPQNVLARFPLQRPPRTAGAGPTLRLSSPRSGAQPTTTRTTEQPRVQPDNRTAPSRTEPNQRTAGHMPNSDPYPGWPAFACRAWRLTNERPNESVRRPATRAATAAQPSSPQLNQERPQGPPNALPSTEDSGRRIESFLNRSLDPAASRTSLPRLTALRPRQGRQASDRAPRFPRSAAEPTRRLPARTDTRRGRPAPDPTIPPPPAESRIRRRPPRRSTK